MLLRLRYNYVDSDGNTVEEQVGPDIAWSMIPDGAIAVQVKIEVADK